MDLNFQELSVEIVHSNPETEDLYGGRWGWFWHESHRPPRGPFSDPGEALSDLAEWVAKRFDANGAPVSPPASEEAVLSTLFLRNADGFLQSAETAAATQSEMALASACYALELILKAYLVSRGRCDEWNRRHLGHDLAAAYLEATFLGLPDEDVRIERFLKLVAVPFARHELLEVVRAQSRILSEIGYVAAIRSLHRAAELRILP